MKDKSLEVSLRLLFGMGGMIIVIVAWLQPMSVVERILTTSIGSIGPLWVLARALPLRAMLANLGIGKNPVGAETERKP